MTRLYIYYDPLPDGTYFRRPVVQGYLHGKRRERRARAKDLRRYREEFGVTKEQARAYNRGYWRVLRGPRRAKALGGPGS